MKFVAPLLAVTNIKASTKFYSELFGLKLREDYGRNVAFDCGLALQEDFDWLADLPKGSVNYKANNGELYFEEDDLNAFALRVKEYGVTFVHPLKTHDWGQRCIRLYDPDGHIIEIGEPMNAVVKRFLKQGKTAEETAKITMQSLTDVQRLQKEIL